MIRRKRRQEATAQEPAVDFLAEMAPLEVEDGLFEAYDGSQEAMVSFNEEAIEDDYLETPEGSVLLSFPQEA